MSGSTRVSLLEEYLSFAYVFLSLSHTHTHNPLCDSHSTQTLIPLLQAIHLHPDHTALWQDLCALCVDSLSSASASAAGSATVLSAVACTFVPDPSSAADLTLSAAALLAAGRRVRYTHSAAAVAPSSSAQSAAALRSAPEAAASRLQLALRYISLFISLLLPLSASCVLLNLLLACTFC